MKNQVLKRVVAALVILPIFLTVCISLAVKAEDVYSGPMTGFMMSPMTVRLTLKPGDTYSGSFWLMNPEQNTLSVSYGLSVRSFYRDDEGKAIFDEEVEDRNQIARWITLDSPDNATLAPGTSNEIKYTINVPYNVPAGGQYAAITATSLSADSGNVNATTLKESVAMAYTIFAEIDGKTIRSGEITNLDLPGYLSDGKIVASSKITNTGNVHGTATYTFEVFPLFSDQPIYSNIDEPETKLILPDRSLTHETTWEETPAIGIFNVSYTVEFEGATTKELKKLVVKCPIWLIFLIFLVITSIVTFTIYRFKARQLRSQAQVSGE